MKADSATNVGDAAPRGEQENWSYKALVAGATGLIGSTLFRRLIDDKRCSRVTVIARQPMTKPIPNSGTKLDYRVTTFDRLEDALKDVQADVVYCALGTTMKKAKTREAFREVDLVYPVRLAQWAKAGGASVFLAVSSMGASTKSKFFYSRVKGEMEEKLSAAGLPELHLFRPSLLTGDRGEFRFGEQAASAVARLTGWAWIGPLRKYKPIQGERVAEAMRIVAARAAYDRLVKGGEPGWPTVRIYESDEIALIAREIKR